MCKNTKIDGLKENSLPGTLTVNGSEEKDELVKETEQEWLKIDIKQEET